MYDHLRQALHQLRATSSSGFEGFIVALVSGLAGMRLQLAKSGSQQGKDAATLPSEDIRISVECKRYAEGKSPSARDLLGGFEEEVSATGGDLDLYLVVSTGSIGIEESRRLLDAGDRHDISVEILDWQSAGLPELGVLCACAPDIAVGELISRDSNADLLKVRKDLDEISGRADFSERKSALQRRLSRAELGFSRARAICNGWIQQKLSSAADARAVFNQPFSVDDGSVGPFSSRENVNKQLDEWFTSWRTHNSPLVLLGNEGVGKSWSALKWWSQFKDDAPLTLLISSNLVDATRFDAMLWSALMRQGSFANQSICERRVNRWLSRDPTNVPSILVILDGINERPRYPWWQMIAAAGESKFASRIAVLATCRQGYWTENLALRCPGVQSATVLPFTDQELAAAWGDRQPQLSALAPDLKQFIRVPRVFRLASNHLESLMTSGDLTVERLLVDDWRQRQELNPALSISYRQVNEFISECARRLRNNEVELTRRDIKELSASIADLPQEELPRAINELLDGPLFERIDAPVERYRVRKERVPYALGMLLAHEVHETTRKVGIEAAREAIGGNIESFRDFDCAVPIIRSSASIAVSDPNIDDEVAAILLEQWATLPQATAEGGEGFGALVPLAPGAYTRVAERLWLSNEFHASGREWVSAALLRWREAESVKPVLEQHCNRWLGIWSRRWFPFLNQPSEERLAQQNDAIEDKVRSLTDSEREFVASANEESETPVAPWISRLALLIISHCPRVPFIDGMLAWCFARSLMGYWDGFDELAWVLRLNDVDAVQTEKALLGRVKYMSEDASEAGTAALRLVCSAIGTKSAVSRIESSRFLESQRPLGARAPELDDAVDPSVERSDKAEVWLKRLDDADVAMRFASSGSNDCDFVFDVGEPWLARFNAEAYASKCCEMLGAASAREGVALRQLALHSIEFLLLVTAQERASLDAARRKLFECLSGDQHDARASESYLLTAVIAESCAAEQLELIIDRPIDALELIELESVFAPITRSFIRAVLESLPESPRALVRTLWFITREPCVLTGTERLAIENLVGANDPLVRAFALRFIHVSRDQELLRGLIAREWSATSTDSQEAFHGSVALCRAPGVKYRDLKSRVVPELLGLLAASDGSDEAIREHGQDLDAMWKTMAELSIDSRLLDDLEQERRVAPRSEGILELEPIHYPLVAEEALRTMQVFGRSPDVEKVDQFFELADPAAFENFSNERRRKMRELIRHAHGAGHHFLATGVRPDGFGNLLRLCPDLVERWTRYLEENERVAPSLLEIYRALATAACSEAPETACRIIRCLSRSTVGFRVTYRPYSVPDFVWLAFLAEDCPGIDSLRAELLDSAFDDERLFQLAVAARVNGRSNWLREAVGARLEQQSCTGHARALTLIGFMDEGCELDALDAQLSGRVGFLEQVAKEARRRLKFNQLARHWFARFLQQPDRSAAWLAFRLFLRCADRRFFGWQEELVVQSGPSDALKRRHLAVNRQRIEQAISKNEGRLNEQFAGIRIPRGEVWPWSSSVAV